ncbi:oligoendopeptidase F [bacterium]|nr:oligoendopeptidase F [bacterium]
MMREVLSMADGSADMGGTRPRNDVPAAHTWNLADIFASDGEWRDARDRVAETMKTVSDFEGRVTESAHTLLTCLSLNTDLSREFEKLFSYAGMKSDEDTRDSRYESMKQEITRIATDFATLSAFIEPELVRLDLTTLNRFLGEEPGLDVYRFYLEDLLRRKAHQLSEKEEKILARAGMLAQGSYTIYTIFANAELPYPEAVLSSGTAVKLDQAGYSRHRQAVNRDDRMIVFRTFWERIGEFRATLGAQLYAQVNRDIFFAESRHYGSTLQASLDDDNIPEAVYHSLIENVNANLNTFHRYLRLRKRMLGVDELTYQDMYAPAVKGVDPEYSIEQAWDLVTAAMAPMGGEYLDLLRRARNERWVDVYPTPGKRSGAYSNDGGYDIHPFMLLNYNGKYSDVGTLAHELGHSLHTWFSNRNQPYPLSDYSIFVAEVASTFNEALLTDHMLNTVTDPDVRLSLLVEYLDDIRGTVFRQTQFAEFELLMHHTAEQGVPLTGDRLTDMYGAILEKYYGHGEGVCRIDDLVKVEWAYIPHFYYNFYVYQYATSFTASTALARLINDGAPGAVDRVIRFLSAGGSKYPIDILKDAGVDMTTREPFDLTMKVMNEVMDEIEEIIKDKG